MAALHDQSRIILRLVPAVRGKWGYDKSFIDQADICLCIHKTSIRPALGSMWVPWQGALVVFDSMSSNRQWHRVLDVVLCLLHTFSKGLQTELAGCILISTDRLKHLQHFAFLQCFDVLVLEGIFLVVGVLSSFLTSPIRDLECGSTDLAASSILFGVFLIL